MSHKLAKLAAPVVAKITEIKPATFLILAAIFALLCWMGYDQQQDEAKTSEVMADINTRSIAKRHAPPDQLAQLESDGRYMTNFDHITTSKASKP
jgi:hypothetical protein